MANSIEVFRDLVVKAHNGSLKLPAFQRNWKWNKKKVITLFDSLRQRYPIGSLLFLSGGGEALSPRAFSSSAEAAVNQKTESLVLDGQQRLTAGIHLFFGTGSTQYFLDLKKLEVLMNQRSVDLKNDDSVEQFVANLDDEDEYLIGRKRVDDPRKLLVERKLLCTSILAQKSLSQAIVDYVEKYPESHDFMHLLVRPHFDMSTSGTVPVISIDADSEMNAISRIFTTLNTTGQLLTPFELVVAILYPKGVDLISDVKEYRELGTFYPNMDKTGEILLQTIAMLANANPKKSTLPDTINETMYATQNNAAFQALEGLGKFLTHGVGAALDVPKLNIIPYDAIFAPMACALKVVTEKNLTGTAKASAHKKLLKWFVASALDQRYQEGVHGKQASDLKDFLGWLNNDELEPAWMKSVTTPNLMLHSIDGAIGKLVQCLINSNDIKDPVVLTDKVGFRDGAVATEKHHMFPKKFVETGVTGWKKGVDKVDIIPNLMLVSRDTNKAWTNNNPYDHIKHALIKNSEEALKAVYAAQFVPAAAYASLKDPFKTVEKFNAFCVLRGQAIQACILQKFDIKPRVTPLSQEEIDSGIEDDSEGDGSLLAIGK